MTRITICIFFSLINSGFFCYFFLFVLNLQEENTHNYRSTLLPPLVSFFFVTESHLDCIPLISFHILSQCLRCDTYLNMTCKRISLERYFGFVETEEVANLHSYPLWLFCLYLYLYIYGGFWYFSKDLVKVVCMAKHLIFHCQWFHGNKNMPQGYFSISFQKGINVQ